MRAARAFGALPAALVTLLQPALADPVALDCRVDVYCVAGGDCAQADARFELEPSGSGYVTFIDAGEISLALISPAEAEVASYLLASPQSVTVLLSIFPDNRFTLTTHEDIKGPHVETSFGTCRTGA
jgi:hypothetical protein